MVAMVGETSQAEILEAGYHKMMTGDSFLQPYGYKEIGRVESRLYGGPLI